MEKPKECHYVVVNVTIFSLNNRTTINFHTDINIKVFYSVVGIFIRQKLYYFLFIKDYVYYVIIYILNFKKDAIFSKITKRYKRNCHFHIFYVIR